MNHRQSAPAYKPSPEEMKQLDVLLGIALLDEGIRQQLVNQRDERLFVAFAFGEETCWWLMSIPATTLEEFAQAILSR